MYDGHMCDVHGGMRRLGFQVAQIQRRLYSYCASATMYYVMIERLNEFTILSKYSVRIRARDLMHCVICALPRPRCHSRATWAVRISALLVQSHGLKAPHQEHGDVRRWQPSRHLRVHKQVGHMVGQDA